MVRAGPRGPDASPRERWGGFGEFAIAARPAVVKMSAAQTANAIEAVVYGGKRRLRPILLTSLTTFFGLAPMILETSIQAQFLIPMAISLGFGVLFATVIILVLVPALYIVVDEKEQQAIWLARRLFGSPTEEVGEALGK